MLFPRPLINLTNYITWATLGRRVLPYAGGILDQPPDLLEDFRIISRVEAEYHKKNEGKGGKNK